LQLVESALASGGFHQLVELEETFFERLLVALALVALELDELLFEVLFHP